MFSHFFAPSSLKPGLVKKKKKKNLKKTLKKQQQQNNKIDRNDNN